MSQMTPMQIDEALKGMTRSQIGEILASVMPDLFAPTEPCMCSTETLERIRAVFERKNTARGFSSPE